MKLQKRMAILACVGIMSMGLLSAQGEGIVYYPTYTDGTAHVYTYNPWKQYEINTKVGFVTDIQLRKGEEVQKIATGDTVQWQVDTDTVADISHVYVKPTVSGLKTNFIINTTQRSYRLIINSNDDGEYVVLWNYPEEDEKDRLVKVEAERKAEEEATALLQSINNTKYDTAYKIKSNKNVSNDYIPTAVFSDGTKTFIELPKGIKDNMPTVYYFDEWQPKKLQLVNYRLKGNIMEIDKLANQFKLVYSQTSHLVIAHESGKKVKTRTEFDKVVDRQAIFDAEQGQTKDITLQTTWIPLKERMRQKRLQEAKEFIKDTQQQPQQNADTEAIDAKIQSLEQELGIQSTDNSDVSNKSTNPQDDNNPVIQQQIAQIYRN